MKVFTQEQNECLSCNAVLHQQQGLTFNACSQYILKDHEIQNATLLLLRFNKYHIKQS